MLENTKQPLAKRMSVLLAQNIQWGRWTSVLPGIRTLCEEMGVSRQTMMLAIRHLEQDGLVSSAEKGKPRRILRKDHPTNLEPPVAFPPRPKRLVSLSSQPVAELPHVDKLALQQLEKSIEKRGYQYTHITAKEVSTGTDHTVIQAIVKSHPADMYMVLGANAECREWLDSQGTPVVYIGGYSSKSKFPSVAFSFSDRCRIALKETVSWNHQRIVLFLPPIMQGKGDQYSEVETLIYDMFENFNLKCSTFNIPRWGQTADELYLAIEKSFMLTPPSAIIVSDANMVPPLLSYLIRHNIKYPEDLSIVCMDDHPLLSHFRPPITHMIKSTSQLVEKILQIIDGIDLSELPSGEQGIRVALQRTSSISKPKGQ